MFCLNSIKCGYIGISNNGQFPHNDNVTFNLVYKG